MYLIYSQNVENHAYNVNNLKFALLNVIYKKKIFHYSKQCLKNCIYCFLMFFERPIISHLIGKKITFYQIYEFKIIIFEFIFQISKTKKQNSTFSNKKICCLALIKSFNNLAALN